MRFVLDSRERAPLLKKHADEVRLLKYDGVYSYDIHLECDDGAVYRIERKRWPDLVESVKQGKLPRQLANVDLLLVEYDRQVNEEYFQGLPDKVAHRYWEHHMGARKYLWHVSMLMPVIPADSEAESLSFLQYLGKKGDSLGLRENKVTSRNVKQAILSALPGINPDRKVGRRRLGAILEEEVDWDLVLEALSPSSWEGQGWGIGAKTIERIEEALE